MCNIYHLHQAFSDAATVGHVVVQCRSAGWGCVDCKRVLFESIRRELDPIRERAAELRERPELVRDVLEQGAARCRAIASETMREVKQRMGLA